METVAVPGDVYLVGGFVRDQLLGRLEADHEKDWVVVGATPAEMESAGFDRIDASFPVFLHPKTREQYALARTERKTSTGHKGFSTKFDASITLEQDLARRDLTINAIAQTADGSHIDPYNGRDDLDNRVLRHVTNAFAEDPLRVFRVARFTAQLPEFQIAPSTKHLMSTMRDELAHLSAERVWGETLKAMFCPAAHRYFRTIYEVGVEPPWFSELPVKEIASVQEKRQLQGESALAAVGWNQPFSMISRFITTMKMSKKQSRLILTASRSSKLIESPTEINAEECYRDLRLLGAFRNDDIFLSFIRPLENCSGLDLSEFAELILSVRRIEVPLTAAMSHEDYQYKFRLDAIQRWISRHRK